MNTCTKDGCEARAVRENGIWKVKGAIARDLQLTLSSLETFPLIRQYFNRPAGLLPIVESNDLDIPG